MSYRSGGGGARRGHLSHKVPNVKLRPAFAPTASEVETSNVDEGASTREKRKRRKLQEEEDDNALSAMDKERIRALNERDGVIDDDSSYDPELAHAQTSHPFASISLCFTALDSAVKEEQAHMARQMGCPKVDRALMADTAALVASEPTGSKYKGAIAHRIPVFSADWIPVCHDRWLRGEELVNPLEMQEERLKCFVGCKIALTGIEPISKRKQFQAAVEANGGLYSGGLDRTCTHLIVSGDTPPIDTSIPDQTFSPKITFALKTNADSRDRRRYLESLIESAKRGETQMNEEQAAAASKELAELPGVIIVWEGWIWDCVALGSQFPTEPWDLEKASAHPMEQETEAFKESRRQEEEAKKLLQDIVAQDAAAHVSAEAVQPGKRSALAESSTIIKVGPDQLEQARIRRRVPSTTPGAGGNSDVAGAGLASADQMLEAMVAAVNQPAPRPADLAAMDVDMNVDEQAAESSAAVGKRRRLALAKPLETESTRQAGASSLVHRSRSDAFDRPAGRADSRGAATGNAVSTATVSGSHSTPTPSAHLSQYDPDLFKGLSFGVHIPGCVTDKLVEAIMLNGGKFVKEETRLGGESVDYLIVKLGSPDVPSDILPPTRLATECWVERCIHTKQVAALESHVAHEPLGHPMPIAGAERLSIHLSGLPLEDVHLSRKLIKAIGAVATPEMSRKRTTHLISAHESGIKLEKAQQWGIPVIGLEWLHATARSGVIQPVAEFAKVAARVDAACSASPASKRVKLCAANTIQGSRLMDTSSMFDLKDGAVKPDEAPPQEANPSQQHASQSRKLGLAPTDVNTLDQKAAARKSGSQSQHSGPTADAPTEQKTADDVAPTAMDDTGAALDESREAPTIRPAKLRPDPAPAVDIPNIINQLAQASERQEVMDGQGSGRPIRRVRSSTRQRSNPAPFAAASAAPAPEAYSASVPEAGADESLTMPESKEDTFDQSYRVMYQDPTAERERKRLLDTFNESHSRSRRRR